MTDAGTRQVRKDNYYLGIAESVAIKATCVRRTYGAIIVKNDEVIATGYNGSPRGCINCTETGCIREQLGILKGDSYNLCTSVHAEMNAMLSAARNEMIGATLYIVGMNATPALIEKSLYAHPFPCLLCHRNIVNSGITRVVGRVPDPENGREAYLDKELDIGAFTFMDRLHALYERTLNDMAAGVDTRLTHIKRQQELGADTPEVRDMLQKCEHEKTRIKNARAVLRSRQELIRVAITEHNTLRDQASLMQDLMSMSEKYQIPIITALQQYVNSAQITDAEITESKEGDNQWGETPLN